MGAHIAVRTAINEEGTVGTTRLRVYCIWFFACLGLALVCGAFTAVTYTQAVTESGRNTLLCLLLLCLTCGAAVAALVSGLASLWHLLQRHPCLKPVPAMARNID